LRVAEAFVAEVASLALGMLFLGHFAEHWPPRAQLSTTTWYRPPKAENRNPKPEGKPNSEARITAVRQDGSARGRKAWFGFRSSAFFRISGLGLRVSGAQVGGTDRMRPATTVQWFAD
jgi:hypothetical protein